MVPPMSKPMARSMPRNCARRPAPIMPATGPDSIIATGSRRACSSDIVPPFERIIAILPAKRAPWSEALEAAEIAADAWADESIEHRRRGAFVFAKFAQDLVAQRHEQPRTFLPAKLRPQRSRARDWRRNAKGKWRRPRYRPPNSFWPSASTSARSSGTRMSPAAFMRSLEFEGEFTRERAERGRWKNRLNASGLLPRPMA